MPDETAPARTPVTRTYLELRTGNAAQPEWPPGFALAREHPCSVALLRSLYAAVGRAYHWHDRDSWTDSDLAGYLRLPNVYVCVLRELGAVRGYFELLRHADGSLEIVYFGLLAAAHGRGLGRSLLQAAVAAAWAAGSERIWLHTCTLDHPAALPNYLARGFVKYRTEEYHVDQSDIA